jgi:hypothetical protein
MENCAKCGEQIDQNEGVVLWDGRAYCSKCVRKSSPALWDYARGHSQYDESIELRERRPSRVYLRYVVTGNCFLLAILAVSVAETVLAAIPITALFLILWYAVAWILPNRLRHWELTIYGGKVFFKEIGVRIPTEAWLENTHWQIADANTATGWLIYELPDQRAILLTLGPLKTSWWDAPVRIPCGLSENKFDVVKSFLELAGVPSADNHGKKSSAGA